MMLEKYLGEREREREKGRERERDLFSEFNAFIDLRKPNNRTL